jgi:hypothetical protein
VNEEFPIKELQKLRETLAKRGFDSSPSNWWVAWQWTDYRLRKKDFLIKTAVEKQPAIEAARLLWDLVDEFHSDIETVNHALATLAKI